MKKVWQPIKDVGLFLLGVITIITGFKVNETPAQGKPSVAEGEAPAQTKAEAGSAATPASTQKASKPRQTARKKIKTVLEKAAPEKASATQYQQPAKK